MDDPSKGIPLSKKSSVRRWAGTVKCCQVPGKSTKRMSTNSVPLAISSTSAIVFAMGLTPAGNLFPEWLMDYRGEEKAKSITQMGTFWDSSSIQNQSDISILLPETDINPRSKLS